MIAGYRAEFFMTIKRKYPPKVIVHEKKPPKPPKVTPKEIKINE